MKISILTPDKAIFEGEVTSIKVPGVLGEFQVLENHAPIVSALESGKVLIRKAVGGEFDFTIEKGFVEVLNNEISLLVQGAKDVPEQEQQEEES